MITIFLLIFASFNTKASELNCSKYLQSNQPVIVTPSGDLIYTSRSYQLEIGEWGYSVNGHIRRWPDIHISEGRLLSHRITSTEMHFLRSQSKYVFTKQTQTFSFMGVRIIDGYQFLFRKNAVLLGLPKGSVFVARELLLKLEDNEPISDTVLGNLINTLDTYTQM